MGVRRKAREFVLQALYSLEMTGDDPQEIKKFYIEEYKLRDKLLEFFEELFDKTVENMEYIDSIIKRHIANWDFDRIAIIDKNILRMGIAEFLYFDSIPYNVTIDEAVEIAKKYSTEKSGSFVNGVLDAIKTKEVLKNA